MAHAAPAARAAEVLVLGVGGERCAVPLAVVREVVADPLVTPLPTAPPAVLGLTGVRGELVAVLDTGLLLGVAPLGRAPWCAVLAVAGGPCALAVDRVPVRAALGVALGGPSGPGRLGAHDVDGRATLLVDVHLLVATLAGGA